MHVSRRCVALAARSASAAAMSPALLVPASFSVVVTSASPSPPKWVAVRYQSSEASHSEQPGAQPVGAEGAAAAGAASAADPREAQIKALQEEVAKLKAQAQELTSARLRVLAEMENVRTIAKRDVAQAKDYGLQSFAKALLNTVDNLHRAVESVPAEAREKRPGNEAMANLYEGVAATERDFVKVLGQHGVSQFGAKGEPFDYNRHEVLLQVPAASAGVAVNTVAQVLKSGYTLKDRVIRVAQVAISVE